MSNIILLDAGPLGKIAHPRPNKDIAEWFQNIINKDFLVIIPEISDYEVRRSFLLENLTKSLQRLDALKKILTYLPINTDMMLKAAEMWAETRRAGRPTSDPKALDCDVILAAQALYVDGIVATENVGHLSLFVEAKHWSDILC
jgi:predicted nucleic acid-binding protein